MGRFHHGDMVAGHDMQADGGKGVPAGVRGVARVLYFFLRSEEGDGCRNDLFGHVMNLGVAFDLPA